MAKKTIKSNLSNEIPYQEQFAMLKSYINVMGRGLINSIIVYGRPGLGKTKTVTDCLKSENLNFVLYSGGLKGSYELAKVLYKHRKNTIIVFDDFDSAFRTRGQVNLLMKALEDEGTKLISWVDTTKKRKRDQIPEQFEFTSGMVFITNKLRIDPAIKSRSKVIKIEMDTKSTLERIRDVLPNYCPKVPMEIKEEVLQWMIENEKKIKRIDFRVYKYCLANCLMDKDQGITDGRWKKWSIREVNT